MNQYDTYKPSGIDWIGDVPSHWEVKQIRFLGEVISGSTPKSSEPSFWDGDINWITPADMKAKTIASGARSITKKGLEEVSSSLLPIGSIILSSRAPIGLVALAEEPLVTNQGCKTLVPNKELNSLFGYYMVLANVDSLKSKGNATTFDELGMGTYKHHKVCIPPLPEQEAIAAYLDKRCGEIDKVITTQERRIELLREMKQSIITRAVTKGINPNAPMKDSGVEWIGEVPAHWEIRRVRTAMQIVRGGSPRPIEKYLSDNGYNWIKIGDTIKGNKYITSTAQKIKAEGLSATRFVKPGDLILSNSMSFGQPYILAIEGCIHDGWLSLSPSKELDKEFLYYTLVSDFCKNQFASHVDGGVVQNLNIDKAKDSILFIPTYNEQREIVAYIEKKTKALDAAITKTQREVELLRELKQATITEVVTGKRKVC